MILKTILSVIVDPIVKAIKDFGIARTVGYFMILVCVGYTTLSFMNIDKTIDKALDRSSTEKADEHDRAVTKRYENSPVVDNLLEEIMYKYGADRVCVVEMHNGTNNVAGLPFIYGEMTYEVCRDGIHSVDEDYTRFNLSRLSFPTYMLEHKVFCGNMEMLTEIDDKFADRLLVNNSTYLCGYTLYGRDGALGYFGVIWCGGEPTDRRDLLKNMGSYAQRLSVLLDR